MNPKNTQSQVSHINCPESQCKTAAHFIINRDIICSKQVLWPFFFFFFFFFFFVLFDLRARVKFVNNDAQIREMTF